MAGSLHLSACVSALIAYFCFVNGAVVAAPKVSITPPLELSGHLGDELSLKCTADVVPAGARLCLYKLEGTGQQRRLRCVTGASVLEHYLTLSARDDGQHVRCVLQQVSSSSALTTLAESLNVPVIVYKSTDQVRLSPANISVVAAEPGDRVRFNCATPDLPGAKFAHLLVIRPGKPTYLRREFSKAFKASKNDDGAEVTCVFKDEGREHAHATLHSRPVRLAVQPAAPPAFHLVQYQSAPKLTLRRNKKITNVELSSESSSDEDSDESPPRAPTVGFGDVYEYKCKAERVIENSRLCLYQLDKGRDKKIEKLMCEHNAKQLVKKLFLTNSAQDSRVLCVAQVFDSAQQVFLTIAKSQFFNITFTRQSNTRVHMRPEGEVTAAAGDRVRVACRATDLPRRVRLTWLETGGAGDRPRIQKVNTKHAQELRAVHAHETGAALRCAARDWDSAAHRPADLARSQPLTLRVIDDGLKGVDNERPEVTVSYGVRNQTVAVRGRVALTCRGARLPLASCLAWLQTHRDQSRVLLSAACGSGETEVRVTLAATEADGGSKLHCAVLRDMAGLQEIARSEAIPIIVQ